MPAVRHHGMAEQSVIGYRIAAGFFALTTLLGWLWFAGTFGVIMSIYVPVILIVLLTATLAPQAAYTSNNRRALAVVYIVGIIASLVVIYIDLTRASGPNTHSAFLRSIQIFVLVMLTKIALVKTEGEDA